LQITERKDKLVKPEGGAHIPFGTLFTDHMLTIDWTKSEGW